MCKTAIISLVFLFLFSGILTAQQTEFRRYSELSVKAGAYLKDHQYGQPEKGYGMSHSFIGKAFGLQFKHMEQKNLGIVVEANYNTESFSSDTLSLSSSSIQVPLFTHIAFNIGSTTLGFDLGPFVTAYLEKPEGFVLDKDILYGMAGGLDYTIPIGKVILGIQGRYYYTLPLNSDDYTGSIRGMFGEVGITLGLRDYKDN